MPNYAAIAKKPVPQTQPIPGREHEMEQNAAGGYGFKMNSLQVMQRFLILGSAGGTYYVGEADHTRNAMSAIQAALVEHGEKAVQLIVDISVNGRAPNNKPALFALALATIPGKDTAETNKAALAALPRVARTASDLLYFASQVNELRGWGRALRRAVGDWFLKKNPDVLSYQAMKYRQRDGWALADLLRLSHPKAENDVTNSVLKWIVDNHVGESTPTQLTVAHMVINGEVHIKDLPKVIRNHRLPREVLPTESLNDPEVWKALMEEMPGHAMIRNLGKMGSVKLIDPLSAGAGKVIDALNDPEFLKRNRLHPLQLLLANHVYSQGRGIKGSLAWDHNHSITDALDRAFYSAFDESFMTQKSAVIAIDVSGSMSGARCAGQENMTAIQGAAMLAMSLKRVIPNNEIICFDTEVHKVSFGNQPAYSDVTGKIMQFSGGGTDCALAFSYALKNGREPDAVIVITDNESWAGDRHAVTDLAKMRSKKPVKAINVAMQAISSSILDGSPDNLETVGFDASVPRIVTEFMEGNI